MGKLKTPPPPEPISDLWELFVGHLKAANKAKRTLETYGDSVRWFRAWLAEQGRPDTSDQLSKPTITTWLGHLHDRGAAYGTVTTRFRSLRRFVRWLAKEGYLPTDPMLGLEVPKGTKKVVDVFTDEEITAMFDTCRSRDYLDRRDLAILRVLFDCGVRLSEVTNMLVDDINFKTGEILVRGKGGKFRKVAFLNKTAEALMKYRLLRNRHPHAASDSWWLGQRGGITDVGVDAMLRRRARQAGIANVHAHRWRHTAAHAHLAAGGQQEDLKVKMGWTSDSMLEVYGRTLREERSLQATRRLGLGDRL